MPSTHTPAASAMLITMTMLNILWQVEVQKSLLLHHCYWEQSLLATPNHIQIQCWGTGHAHFQRRTWSK
jgi:hypothetical protein